jgi:hypothetical protein
MRTLRPLALACGLAVAAPAMAQGGLPPLSQNSYINDRLLVAAIGDQIRRNCPTISERRSVVRAHALALLSYAMNLGYDRATIDAYLADPRARAAMEARRDAWLVANGAVRGDADSYCRIGLREIGRGTFLGSLLRAH